MTKPHTPIADLKNLALVHSHFLDPIRSLLYRNPLIFSSTALRHPSLHGPMESIAARQKGERSIQILQSALLSNPTLGSFVRSLILLEEVAPHFPTAIVALLRLTPALRELCMPFVETKYQEDVMASVCRMKDLRVIRFACAGWNESDLRRIATSCSNLEELILVGDGVRFCEGTVVEPYAFHNLLSLKVVIATYTTFYLTDAHLLALVSHSRRLQRFVVKGNFGHAVDSPFAHHLTLQGVAAVMERRGKSLREICVHSSFREHNTLNIGASFPALNLSSPHKSDTGTMLCRHRIDARHRISSHLLYQPTSSRSDWSLPCLSLSPPSPRLSSHFHLSSSHCESVIINDCLLFT